jgi:hypothetical protein
MPRKARTHNAAVRPQPKAKKHRRDAEAAEARGVSFSSRALYRVAGAESAEQGKEYINLCALSVSAVKKCCQKNKKLQSSYTKEGQDPTGEADPQSVIQRTRPIRLRMKGMSKARMPAATRVPIATAPNKRTIAPSAVASKNPAIHPPR